MNSYEKIFINLTNLITAGMDEALSKKDAELFDKYKFFVDLLGEAEKRGAAQRQACKNCGEIVAMSSWVEYQCPACLY